MEMQRWSRTGEREARESANVVPRTKRMKASSRKKKEERVEETTKMTSFDEPMREKMFVTIGGLNTPSSDSG